MSKLTAKIMYCQTVWPHHVVPFLTDFLKDIVESVNLSDSLPRFSVQSNQNKLFDSYRAGKRRERKNNEEEEEQKSGHLY